MRSRLNEGLHQRAPVSVIAIDRSRKDRAGCSLVHKAEAFRGDVCAPWRCYAVPLSTAILIVINEPHGIARFSMRPPAQLYRGDTVYAHTYTRTRTSRASRELRCTMRRSRRRSAASSIIDAPNSTSHVRM